MIKVYTSPSCTSCRKAKAWLQANQLEFEEKNIEKRINPKLYMEDGKTIISVAFPYKGDASPKDDLYFCRTVNRK